MDVVSVDMVHLASLIYIFIYLFFTFEGNFIPFFKCYIYCKNIAALVLSKSINTSRFLITNSRLSGIKQVSKQVEQSSNFRTSHLFTVMQLFKPGKDNTYARM